MAKIMNPLGNILAITLIISIWVNIISLLATYGGSQSDFYMVEAYTRKTVREVDQTEANSINDEPNSQPTGDTSKVPISNLHDNTNNNFRDDVGGNNTRVNTGKRTNIVVGTSASVSSTSSCDPNQIQDDQLTIKIEKEILTRAAINATCEPERGAKRSVKGSLEERYLKNCFRYKLSDLLPPNLFNFVVTTERSLCTKTLEEFIQLDETIEIFDDLFMKLLSRYNCHNGYSVKWNCDDCKKAYKDWLCATHLPVYKMEHQIKPCISFCERVEQRCPYLHPITREQYGGQPVFICRDPNIPFVPQITPDIPYSEAGKCYDLCHLDPNSTELTVDTLSKYDYCDCPSLDSISAQISSEIGPTTIEPTIDDYDYMGPSQKNPHAHHKKLMELLEVLANYKNQSKTHRYHADHSSIEHSKYSQTTHLHQMS